ncbi:MAG: prepilin-type N-terminal cleavage/methylation domain-containing protein [Rhodospirillales bacterium]|nr:prepilin-type N-terminal cleavage/methylation domain-containing protein [Rhodospirillales bacterium]
MSRRRRITTLVMNAACAQRRGLTLLELLVVLVILAALGTVMLTQTTSLTNEARYQQTVRMLEQMQDTVVGRQPVGAEDPTAIPPGFVSDMGRLPAAVADGPSMFTLAELWDRQLFAATGTAGDLLFRPRVLEGLDESLEMLSGWRGPYVRLPVGSSNLRDGWGGDYELDDDAGQTVNAAGDPIGRVSSDGPGLGDAFEPVVPLEIVFADSDATPAIDRWNGSLPTDNLTVNYDLTLSTGSIHGVVRLYGIDNGVPVLLLQSDVFTGTAGTTTPVAVVFDDPDEPGTPLLSLSTVKGPKVLRAYQIDDATAPPTDPNNPAANLTLKAKSTPLRFTLPAGGLNGALPPLNLKGQ